MTCSAGPRHRKGLALAVLVGLGGGACSGATQGVAPRAGAQATSPGTPTTPGDAHAGAEPNASPAVEEAAPPSAPVRWVAAKDCPLSYDYRIGYRMEMVAVGFGSGFDMLGQVEARTESSRSALKFVWARMDVVAPTGTVKGVRTDEKLGEVPIATDGVRWTQVDQKTPAAATPQPNFFAYTGMVNLWPSLPGEARLGARATWTVPPQTVGGMALSAFAGVKQNTPKIESTPLELKKWIRVGGELACVLEGSWEKEQTTEEKVSAQRVIKRTSVRGAARFVVLASGRLLSSEIRQATDNLQTQQGEHLATDVEAPGADTHEDISSEVRLVGACKGVTMPPLHPPAAPDERAMMLHARLRDLASHQDRAAIGALLAPALVGRQDRAALVDAILAFAKRFGDNALGMPARPAAGALRIEGNRIRFDLVGIASQQPSYSGSVVITVTLDVEQKGDQYWLRGIKAVTQAAPQKDMFEISETRIFIGDAPAPVPVKPRSTSGVIDRF